MTQPNDSILVTPGTGATVATHLVNSKEYQVVMLADSAGHIDGTRDTYVLYCPPVSVVGANKLHFDLWNGTAAQAMKVLSLQFFSDLDIAVAGVIAIRMDVFRSTAIGTAGTAVATEATTAVRTFYRLDPAMTALPATVTCREAPTGGATAGAFLGSQYIQPEETATSMGYITQDAKIFGEREVTVPFGTGLRMAQGPVASVGKVGCRAVFTLT